MRHEGEVMIEDVYPLSSAQVRTMLHAGRAGVSATVGWSTVRGEEFSREAVTVAVTAVAARHPGLRTTIAAAGHADALQLVRPRAEIRVTEIDLRANSTGESEDRLRADRDARRATARDTECELVLYRLPTGVAITLLHPYVLLDEIAAAQVLDEVLAGTRQGVPAMPSPEIGEDVRTPRDVLAADPPGPRADLIPPTAWSGTEECAEVEIPRDLVVALAGLGELPQVLLAGHAAVVAHLTGETTAAVARITGTRPAPGRAVGSFTDVEAVRATLSGSWRELVDGVTCAVEATVETAFAHRGEAEAALRGYAPLTVTASQRADGAYALQVLLRGPDGRWRGCRAREVAELHRRVYEAMAAVPDGPAADAARLGAARRGGTESLPAPADQTLHGLIEARARVTPEAIAVVDGGRRLTYGELWGRALRLAAALRDGGVRTGDVVAVQLPRSAELVIAFAGALAAGAVLLPLDVDYPAARRRYALADSGAVALVGPAETGDAELAGFTGARLAVPTETAGESLGPVRVSPRQAAYLLYTSGSTGTPKGVLVPHFAAVHQMGWIVGMLGLTPADRVAQRTPVAFDASVWEFFATLAAGAAVVVVPTAVGKDVTALARLLTVEQVTVFQAVPALVAAYLDGGAFREAQSLRVICCGGEVLPQALADALLSQVNVRLVNLYGPTENCIHATWWQAERNGTGASVPIGEPVAGVRAEVRNGELWPVLDGTPGELMLGGVQLAHGYHGRPGLTAERFVPDPDGVGERLYRTGDIVRTLPTGACEFLGRRDDQVKIRGVRIEIAEVAATLRAWPSAQDAAVAMVDGELVGYLVWPQAPQEGTEMVRDWLAERLPAPMVPATVVIVDAVPRLPNGKVDQRALPAVAEASLHFVAPRNDTERAVTRLMARVLGVDAVGVHDDFFELGGSPRQAVRLAAEIAAELGRPTDPADLFTTPTAAGIAAGLC